ncbi:MAG: hypothetical protein ACJAY2_002300, partial [Pseudomonadales bacterium]
DSVIAAAYAAPATSLIASASLESDLTGSDGAVVGPTKLNPK